MPQKRKARALLAAQISISAAALGFLSFGLLRGEWQDVLRKAITICLECVGIG